MLNQQRENFIKRQAELQARTARDVANRTQTTQINKVPETTVTPPVQQKGSWLADRGKYEEILRVQRMPINAQIKRVIECLEKNRQGLTAEEIKALTLVNIDGNSELRTNLRSNMKIKFDGTKYNYKAKHELKGKDELLHLIRERKDGIPFAEVKDSYSEVSEDVQILKEAGQIWVLQNHDIQEDVLYPNDPRIQINVDEDVKMVFRGIKLPDFQDIEGELKSMGMTTATNASRRATLNMTSNQNRSKPKVKKRRESKRMKYTNVHLPELLKGIDLPPDM